MSFQPGDKVFAKMKGFSNWPARVNPLPPHVHVPKGKLPIFFYGTHQVSFIHNKAVFPFEKYREKWGKPKANNHFMSAMEEIDSNPDVLLLGKDPDAMDFLLSVYPDVGAETKQIRVNPQTSPSSGLSPQSVETNSLVDEEMKTEKAPFPCATRDSEHDTDLSPNEASDDESYAPKPKSQKKRADASSQAKRPAARRKSTKEVTSVKSVPKTGAKRSAQQNSRSSVPSGTKRRRQASSSTLDDAEEKASLSSISSISDDEEDPLASWQKADAARRNEIEAKLQELEKRRQREEEKAIRQAKKQAAKSKQHSSRKQADRQRSTSPHPVASPSVDFVKSETETEAITVPSVVPTPAPDPVSQLASSVTSDSESAVQQSLESREARRMAKRLMKKEAKREAKKAEKREAKRLEKAALKKQKQEEKEQQMRRQAAAEGTRLESIPEDAAAAAAAATAASDNTSEVSGQEDTATCCTPPPPPPVVENGEETTPAATAVQENAVTTAPVEDVDSSPAEKSPSLSSPVANSAHSTTPSDSPKRRRPLSHSRSPQMVPAAEEAADVPVSPSSLTDEHVSDLPQHHRPPTPPISPADSDNQSTPTAAAVTPPSPQSQKQSSPTPAENKPSVKSPVIKTPSPPPPPPANDAHSPLLSTSPQDDESDEDVGGGGGHRRHRDRLAGHRKRRLAKLSSGSESEEEEEEKKRGSDKEVAKQHPSHPRHHGKLARTDGHIANGGGSRGATEPREHSQRTENAAAVERKSPPTLDCLQQLRNLNRQLKASLMRGHDDHANALAIFDQICAVPATLVQLTQASDLTDCVKKCRRYKLSAEVREKAQKVLAHFQSIQAAASPEELQQAMAIVAERQKQAKMSAANQDESSQGSPAVATGTVSQQAHAADTEAPSAPPRPISPTRYWEEKRASIKAELDERANSVLSMIRATEERVAAAASAVTSPAGFKRPSYSYDPPANAAGAAAAGMEDDATVISRVDEIASYFEANAWLSRHNTKAPRGKHSVSANTTTSSSPPPPPPPPPLALTQLTASMAAPADTDTDLDLDTRIRRMMDSSGPSPAVPPPPQNPKDSSSHRHHHHHHHQRHRARNGSGSSPVPPPPPPPPLPLRPQSVLSASDTTQPLPPQSRTSTLPADLLAKRELIASKVAAKRAADKAAAAAAAAGVLSAKQPKSTAAATTVSTGGGAGVLIESLDKIPLPSSPPPPPPVNKKTTAAAAAVGTENMAVANGDNSNSNNNNDETDIYDLLGV